jgi:hypothetical protein
MALDVGRDKLPMVHPFYAAGASENPIGYSINANMVGFDEAGQNSSKASPTTTGSQIAVMGPKGNITYKESTTRSPKEGNLYGDGVPIIGYRPRVQPISKVGQRDYSTGTDAVRDGTVILEKLIQLPNGKFTGLYKVLATEELILRAYRNIKSVPGNMTPGTENVTLDGFSANFVNELIFSLKNETFAFKPVRREYIPKKNGKMRPLGIPSSRDKIVQEMMRILLEIAYEPIFCDSSHGFRPKRGCHSALKQISTWNGHTW